MTAKGNGYYHTENATFWYIDDILFIEPAVGRIEISFGMSQSQFDAFKQFLKKARDSWGEDFHENYGINFMAEFHESELYLYIETAVNKKWSRTLIPLSKYDVNLLSEMESFNG